MRRSAICAALSVVLLATGCIGRFELVRRVYDFNQKVDQNKYIRELWFLGLSTVQVYTAVTFIDAIFGNAVEFFSGTNPFLSAVDQPENGRVALAPAGEDAWTFTALDDQNHKQELRLVRQADGFAAYDPSGQLLGRTVEESGQFRFVRVERP